MVNECLKGTSIRRVISTRDNLLSIISDDVEKFLLVEKTHPSIDSFLLSTKLLLIILSPLHVYTFLVPLETIRYRLAFLRKHGPIIPAVAQNPLLC